MPIAPCLTDLLRCPSTGQPLTATNDELVSTGGIHYPVFANIPWLLPEPRHSVVDWQIKVSGFYELQSQEINRLHAKRQKAKGLTRERLLKLTEAKQHFARRAAELCQPILQEAPDPRLLKAILPHQAPRTQNLLSYEPNIYRDWVWGHDENQLTSQLVQNLLAGQSVQRLLVPGCGAGRLLSDLHGHLNPQFTVGTDINPLLMYTASRMLNGESFSLYEFPSAPINLASCAVKQTLRGTAASENLYLAFADVLNSPFAPQSFDCLVTPWLIDILPSSLETTLQALNQYLTVGGTWINFGSLVFNQSDPGLHYSIEEVVELAPAFGFEIETWQQTQIPYLQSPHCAGHRSELVTAWRARKTNAVAPPKTTQHLPPWLLDSAAPVPHLDLFTRAGHESAVTGEILFWANGQISISKMASRLSKKYKVDKAAAQSTITQLFRQVYEQSR